MKPDHRPIDLQPVFTNLVLKYNADRRLADELWDEIETAYRAPKRFYHTLQHLQHIMADLQTVKQLLNVWEAVLFAVFYHDVVYNSSQTDNEERSAALMHSRLSRIEVPAETIEKCRTLILATKAHSSTDDNDICLFTDADLAILGQNEQAYRTYAANVRKEYAQFPDALYVPGRRKVLEHFLSMKRIYKSDAFYAKYEQAARKNIRTEIEKLGNK